MRSAWVHKTAPAAYAPNSSFEATKQTRINRQVVEHRSKQCPGGASRTAAAWALQRPFAAGPKPRSSLLPIATQGETAVYLHQAMAAADDGEVVTPEIAWQWYTGNHQYSDKEWTTYQGQWTMYNGAGTGEGDVARAYHGIRCFRLAGKDNRQLQHKNLIAINLGFGKPVQRHDGFWESNYTYSYDEPTRSCSTRPQSSEDGLQPHQLRRLTVVTPNAYLSSPAALPPAQPDVADSGAGAGSKDTSGPGRSILPAGVWAYEAFFEDGMHRWSMGAVYELPSRRLRQTFLIREYSILVDPDTSLDPQKLPIPDARPGVGDPEAAVDATAGRAPSVVAVWYGADGQLRKQAQGRARKELADAPDTRLLQYPDGMWARIPEELPAAGSSGADTTFTWGGLMRGGLAYQQLQATYAADTGALASLSSLAWQ